jgi:hypothetical protein
MDVGEVLSLLDEREAACRAECDRLRAEAERIGELLVVCQAELERLVTARGVVGELVVTRPAVGPRHQRLPVRAAVKAPAQVNGTVLMARTREVEVFTDRVLAVLAERGRAVRCQEVVAALGEDATVARHVERVRHRLKKLRAAGRVEEMTPGMFTLPRARGPAKG